MKIKISPLLPFLIAIFIFCDGSILIVPILVSAFLHEMGHIFAILLSGGKIELIHILPFGAQIVLKNSQYLSYKNEMIISMAGITVNFLLFIVFFIINILLNSNNIAEFIIICNLMLMLVNILPIVPLDGGRFLYAYLLSKFDIVLASFISDFVSIIFLNLIIVLGFLILFVTNYNFSLILIGIYFLTAFIARKIKKL